MNKFIVTLVLASVLAVPAVGFAQTEDIVQLNNLTITAVSPTTYPTLMLITAQAPGVACLKYFDNRASAGFAYPCPAQTQYQIRAESNTILLLKNRARASIGDFAVGDQINVYGFLDANGINMDALIMRNLKQSAVRYYTQINNLTVQTAPSSYLPTTFTVLGRANSSYMPTPSPQYQITLTSQTSVLYRDRRYMPVSEIQVGDQINVYGLYNPATLAFDAVVFRDLSRPGIVIVPPPTPPPPYNGTVPVITSVSGPTNLTVNQTGTWAISAYDPDNNNNNLTYTVTWGDEYNYAYGTASSPMMQNNSQTGTFTHSYANAGNYTVTFTVRDTSGLSAVSTLTVSVGGSVSSTPVINYISPNSGQIGTYVTLYGSGFASNRNIIYFAQGAMSGVSIGSSDGTTMSFTVPQSIGPYCPPGASCALYLMQVTPGQYQVSVADASGVRSNSVMFTVQ